jgi:hypothetical protein
MPGWSGKEFAKPTGAVSSLRLPGRTGSGTLRAVIRQDYLLRMIEQAARLLARLTGLDGKRDGAEATELSRQLARQWLAVDEETLLQMDECALIDHLQHQGSVAEFPVRLGIAISLLQARQRQLQEAGRAGGAAQARATALGLLLRAHIQGIAPELPGFTPRLTDLHGEMVFDELPDRTVVLLICHHEHEGQFAMAEDVLHALKERNGRSPWLLELGREFYERLLKHDDAELAEGNLPRSEVESGLAEWPGPLASPADPAIGQGRITGEHPL